LESSAADGGRRLARRNYAVRGGAFAYSFLVLGLLGWERGLGPVFWVALVASFLVYPHLLLLRALRSSNPRQAEIQNIFIDAPLFGLWTAGLHFPTWVAHAALSSVTLNAIVARGVPGALLAVALFAAGAALWVAGFGFQYWAPTSDLVSTLCFFGALGYTLAVGFVVHVQWRRLMSARDDLRAGEARYRVITENAADLIAMVDRSGRWLYTSPAYKRIFDDADLAVGADAFRRVHPDDADRARAAVVRAAATGKDHELALRLIGRDGGIRQCPHAGAAPRGRERRAHPSAPGGLDGGDPDHRGRWHGAVCQPRLLRDHGLFARPGARPSRIGPAQRTAAPGVLRGRPCHGAARRPLVRDPVEPAQERSRLQGAALDSGSPRPGRKSHPLRDGLLRFYEIDSNLRP
jgi:PAS domain S-box-containing protein